MVWAHPIGADSLSLGIGRLRWRLVDGLERVCLLLDSLAQHAGIKEHLPGGHVTLATASVASLVLPPAAMAAYLAGSRRRLLASKTNQGSVY